MESYDVVIIGAGPAGLRCAEVLGGSALSVLLVDRKDVIGPKVCAGGLTMLSNNFDLPSDKTLTFGRQHVMLNGREHIVTLKNPLRTIDRADLGRHQLLLLEKYDNVDILTGTAVRDIGEGHVVLGEGKQIRFRYLVGADGSSSLVRKHLGIGNRIYVGIQYVIPSMSDKIVWFLQPNLLASGYGWIFPHRSFTSSGAFFNPRHITAGRAKAALNTLLDSYGIDYRGARFEGGPVNCLYRGMQFGNIFLAGDAAGLVSAGTGEGISYALISGEAIGKHLVDGRYDFARIKMILRYKKRQEFILSLLDGLPFMQSLTFRMFILMMGLPSFQSFLGN